MSTYAPGVRCLVDSPSTPQVVTLESIYSEEKWGCVGCGLHPVRWSVEEDPEYWYCQCGLIPLDGHEPEAEDVGVYEPSPAEESIPG